MTKFETIIVKLATLKEQNINQTKMIDELRIDFKKHDVKYEPFRDMCTSNKTKLKWGVFPALGIIFSILAYIIWGV